MNLTVMIANANTHLITTITHLLRERGQTIAVAESCTGGLVSVALTQLAGSSAWVRCNWVTYANEAKIQQLGVPAQLIEDDGAVSESVALAMAYGALSRAETHWAMATTGIAGPDGGSAEKPVGTCWVAVVSTTGARPVTQCLQGNSEASRDELRQWFTQQALGLLLQALQQQPL